jgi:Zn-dependent oligopeptidase
LKPALAAVLFAVCASARAEPLRFDRTPAELSAHCREGLAKARTAVDAIAAAPAAGRGFDATVAALDRALGDLAERTNADAFLKNVASSSATRAAAGDCEVALSMFNVETFAREDLYRALADYAAKQEPLRGEDARLLEMTLRDFKRSGLALPPKTRSEVSALRKRLAELESSFGTNLNETRGSALFERGRLAGLPADLVARLERVDGKYKVGTDYPTYFPFMENADDASARCEMEAQASDRAASKNLPLLDEMLEKRDAAARLLGYASHAHFVVETRMAKTPAVVDAFIARLDGKLTPLAETELAALRGLKREREGAASDGVIHAWDFRYYDNQLKKTRYQVDQEKVREYFPADLVVEQTLAIYQAMLGVKFKPVAGAAAWHEDARLFEVSDASGGGPIAYFYIDLYPRPGKFSHAAAFTLIDGRVLPDGSYSKPVAALVANLDKPSAGRPSLLSHDDVTTFFHEFGHIMHQTLTKAKYSRFSGANVAQDFVEAPSQMLENWVWEPEVLRALSGHYKDRSRKIPKELLDKLVAAKNADVGLLSRRQVFFAALDQAYHDGRPPKDTTAVYARMLPAYSMIPMSAGTHPQASLGHLAGYDGSLYSYTWSKVYAQDMFSVFKASGVMNPAIGRRYRTEILEKGSSRDEMESLKAFLGREPNENAFLESIGLKAGKS